MPRYIAVTLLTIGAGLIPTNSKVGRGVGIVFIAVVLLSWLME